MKENDKNAIDHHAHGPLVLLIIFKPGGFEIKTLSQSRVSFFLFFLFFFFGFAQESIANEPC